MITAPIPGAFAITVVDPDRRFGPSESGARGALVEVEGRFLARVGSGYYVIATPAGDLGARILPGNVLRVALALPRP